MNHKSEQKIFFVTSLAEPVWRQIAGETLRPSDLTEVDRDYVASLLCIRDMEDDQKVFQTLELPFSTPSAKGHEVPLSTRYNRTSLSSKLIVQKQCSIFPGTRV